MHNELALEHLERAVQEAPQNQLRNTLDGKTARRWESEAAFFDRLAQGFAEVEPLSPAVLARYLAFPRRIYDKEFRFRLLGDLHGQKVLDLGCGEGSNAVLLARAGARVDGVDISEKLIEVANRRAHAEGLLERLRFHCAPVERVNLPERSFDVIWGDGVLHHLIDVLEPTMEHLCRWAKPGAMFMFCEPLSLSPVLRRLRKHVPVHTDATPDERPLEARELAMVKRFLPDLSVRHFHLLGRLTRFAIPSGKYETSSALRRTLADALHAFDYAALSVDRLSRLGGMAVLWGRLDP